MSRNFDFTESGAGAVEKLVSAGVRLPGVRYSQEEVEQIKEFVYQLPFMDNVIEGAIQAIRVFKDQCENTEQVQNHMAYLAGVSSGQTLDLILKKEKFEYEETKRQLCHLTAIYTRDKVLTEMFNRSRDVLDTEDYTNEMDRTHKILNEYGSQNKELAIDDSELEEDMKEIRENFGLKKKNKKNRKKRKKNNKKRDKEQDSMIMERIEDNLRNKPDDRIPDIALHELHYFAEEVSELFDRKEVDKWVLKRARSIYGKVVKKFGNTRKVKNAFAHSLGEYGTTIVTEFYKANPFPLKRFEQIDNLMNTYCMYLENLIQSRIFKERINPDPHKGYLPGLLERLNVEDAVGDAINQTMDFAMEVNQKVSPRSILDEMELEEVETELGKVTDLIEIADSFIKYGSMMYSSIVDKYGNSSDVRLRYSKAVGAAAALMSERYYEFLGEFSKYKNDAKFQSLENVSDYMGFYVSTILLKESLKGWKKD